MSGSRQGWSSLPSAAAAALHPLVRDDTRGWRRAAQGARTPVMKRGVAISRTKQPASAGMVPSREQGWHGGDRARSRLLFGQRDDLGAIDGYLLVGLRAVGHAHAAWCLKAEHPQLWRGLSLRRHQAGRSGGVVKHGRRPFQPAAPPRQTSSKRAGASACESTSWSREYTLSALSGRRQRMPQ